MAERDATDREAELERLREQKRMRYLRLAQARGEGGDYPANPVDLSTEASADFLQRYPMTVIEFWAAWCKPCLKLRPVVEELAEEFWGDIVFGRINLDEHVDARERFEVTVLPTLLLFQKGKEIDRLLGGLTGQRLSKSLAPYARKPDAPIARKGTSRPPGRIGE